MISFLSVAHYTVKAMDKMKKETHPSNVVAHYGVKPTDKMGEKTIDHHNHNAAGL